MVRASRAGTTAEVGGGGREASKAREEPYSPLYKVIAVSRGLLSG